MKDVHIAQAKMLRVMQIVFYLYQGKRTIREMAARFDMGIRTIYRYLHLIEAMGLALDSDWEDRYFIAIDKCPLCGENHKTLDGRSTKPGSYKRNKRNSKSLSL